MGVRRKNKARLDRKRVIKIAPKEKAIFLDRDGTMIRFIPSLVELSKVRLFRGTPEAIKKFNEMGFLVIMATNQPAVAKGLITPEGVDAIHIAIKTRLKKRGATMHAAYFCPHHPEKHPDTPPHALKYRIKCDCRKPGPGLLLQAINKFNIDPKKSFMIGDSMIDILAGACAGVKTIFVKTGPGHVRDKELAPEAKPDFVAKNLLEACSIIRRSSKKKARR